MWLIELETFTTWPFTEKVYQSLLKSIKVNKYIAEQAICYNECVFSLAFYTKNEMP